MPSITIFCNQVDASLVSGDVTSYANARTAANADSIRAQSGDQYAGQAKEGDNGFFVYRTALIFDPSELVGASITSALLRLYEGNSSAISDAQNLVLVPGDDVADSGVVLADFGDLLDDTTEWGSISSADFWDGVASDEDIALNATAITALESAISGGTLLKIALRGQHDIDNVADTGFIERNRFNFTGPTGATSSQRPRLIVTFKASLPADDLSRVTGIRHIYKPGLFRMILSLGDVSNTIEIAEHKVRKELEIPEQLTPDIPLPVQPPTPPSPPTPRFREPPPLFPSSRITTEEQLPGVTAPPEVIPTEELLPRGEQPRQNLWRRITPWKEEAGETFGSEVIERFRNVGRFFGGLFR